MIFSSFWVGENEDKKKLKSCPPRVYWHDNMLDNMEHACIAPNLDELWTSRKLDDGIDIDNDEFGDEDTKAYYPRKKKENNRSDAYLRRSETLVLIIDGKTFDETFAGPS